MTTMHDSDTRTPEVAGWDGYVPSNQRDAEMIEEVVAKVGAQHRFDIYRVYFNGFGAGCDRTFAETLKATADATLVQTAPLDVETAADVDGVAAALLGQDEPNRCPECKLLSAHKPFCSRPVKLPWEGEPGDDGRCVSVHEVYGRCWSYAGHDGQHFVEVGDEGEAAETWTDEPDESEYAVATDATWLSAVTGDDSGEIVHAIDAVGNNASGWYWSCRCGEGGFELAAREYAQREAREHLDEVGTRVFTAKLPVGYSNITKDTNPDAIDGMELGRLHGKGDHSACEHDAPAEAGVAPESGTAVA